jgi:hypothetical protein
MLEIIKRHGSDTKFNHDWFWEGSLTEFVIYFTANKTGYGNITFPFDHKIFRDKIVYLKLWAKQLILSTIYMCRSIEELVEEIHIMCRQCVQLRSHRFLTILSRLDGSKFKYWNLWRYKIKIYFYYEPSDGDWTVKTLWLHVVADYTGFRSLVEVVLHLEGCVTLSNKKSRNFKSFNFKENYRSTSRLYILFFMQWNLWMHVHFNYN